MSNLLAGKKGLTSRIRRPYIRTQTFLFDRMEGTVSVLVYHRLADQYRQMIRQRFPELEVTAGFDRETLFKHLPGAEILIAWQFAVEALEKATRLRWIQLTSAGADHLLEARDSLRHRLVTNTRGIHADIMADYTFGAIFMLLWDVPGLLCDQQEKRWINKYVSPLAGRTLGIVGVGAVGSEIARRARSFHMSVVGVKRSSIPVDGVEQMFGPDRLREMLHLSDFVVLLLPATPETCHMIGEPELRSMKRTSYLINISRGSVIEESALLRALQENWIAGAVLDVFEKEPLPPESPLWTLKNAILTPHISGNLQNYSERVMEIFSENYLRWKAGRPLLNVVDLEKGY